MRYLKKWWKSLFTKNFIVALFLITLPVFIGVIFYSRNMESIYLDEICQVNLEKLQNDKELVETLLKQGDYLAYSLLSREETKIYCEWDQTSEFYADAVLSLHDEITFILDTHAYIASIQIYSVAKEYMLGRGELWDAGSMRDQTWRPAVESLQHKRKIQFRKKNDIYPCYLSMTYPILGKNTKVIGAVVMDISIEKMAKLIAGGDTDTEYFWLGEGGELYFCQDYKWMETHDRIPESLQSIREVEADAAQMQWINGEARITTCVDSEYFPWKYYAVNTAESYLEKVNHFNRVILNVVAATVFIYALISLLLAFYSYRPVKSISQCIPLRGNSAGEEREDDDISRIKGWIRDTWQENRQLQIDIDERVRMLEEMQLYALQNQINPHFLYNTMDTINWTAVKYLGSENEVSDMLKKLAQLLRVGLGKDILTTVEEELEHVRIYLQLVEKRYKSRLQVEWDINEDILPDGIVKLSMQPIIENALTHGLRDNRYYGTIYITGQLEKERIILKIQNNGSGMEPEKMEEWNRQLEQEELYASHHIGLMNVNQRFKLVFGKESGLKLSQEADLFTVTVIFPAMKIF